MKLRKKIVGLGIAFLLGAFSMVGCSTGSGSGGDSSLAAIQERGEVRIAVFGDLIPYGYMDENGNHQGYDVYLAKQIGKDLLGSEDKVKFVVLNAEERVDALKSNKVDIVLANFTKTAEREKVVDFAEPYMKVAIGVVSKKDNLITNVEQLDGQSLIVTKGTTSELYFTKNHPQVKLEKFDSKSQQFAALTDGRVNALADDNSYLYGWVKNNPDFAVGIKELGEIETINPAVKKGNSTLLEWLNKEIKSLTQEKFFVKAYDETLKSFFGEEIEAKDLIME
ncbi:amino acid ABC transporter substrate-binding protein [Clostridia bacterium]|nr:amino acid ABC transporter substrate-binding protein [Clostridia bacterium]